MNHEKESNESGKFVFVSYEGSKLSTDSNVRDVIRRRAMKHTATIRKKSGGYRKHNVGQLPIEFQQPSGCRDEDTHIAGIAAFTGTRYWKASLSPPPTDSFMIAMVKTPSLLKLASPVTTLHLGISKLFCFRADCVCFGKVVSKMPAYLESQRLLSFISNRYGCVASVTHAANCLIARLGHIVETRGRWSPDSDPIALKYYSRAIGSIQEAINDESLRTMLETLCSVQLLGMFEVCRTSLF